MEYARISRLPGFSSSRSSIEPLGQFRMSAPSNGGVIEVSEFPGITTMLLQPAGTIGLLLYMPGLDPNEMGEGTITQLSAEAARAIAGSLTRLADQLAEQDANQ
jgi:hypothetical protein